MSTPQPMTKEQQDNLAWITDQLTKLVELEKTDSRKIAAILLTQLDTHTAISFPEAVANYHARNNGDMSKAGPLAWGVLHHRALQKVEDVAAELSWLKGSFKSSIPCSLCRDFLRQYIDAHMPDFSRYFEWTVELHNAVNEKTKGVTGNTQAGKQYTLDEARAIWVK